MSPQWSLFVGFPWQLPWLGHLPVPKSLSLPEWPFIQSDIRSEHVYLTFTIKSITNSTAVLLIFEDFSTNSTDFEKRLHCLLTFVCLITSQHESCPHSIRFRFIEGRSSLILPYLRVAQSVGLQRLQSQIQLPWSFPASSVYSISLSFPSWRPLLDAGLFLLGWFLHTLLCPLWIYPSIFNDQRPFQTLFGLHRFQSHLPLDQMDLDILSWIWHASYMICKSNSMRPTITPTASVGVDH